MSVTSSWLGWLGLMLWISSMASGLDKVPWAGLRVANATATQGEGSALRITLDGKPWQVEGMASGEVSALRRLPSGQHRLDFALDGIEGHRVVLDLKEEAMVTLVPYLRWSEPERRWSIRVIRLDAGTWRDERSLCVLHLGRAEPQRLEMKQGAGSWQALSLRRLKVQELPLAQKRGYLPLRAGRQRLASMPVFERGRHVLVLYESTDGKLATLAYRDRPWPGRIEGEHSR
ncbi:MAG: hypothetical protein R3242_06120 [Akkermansiaceae bacterium]|nr:hypothetical protein [Akkermansiaceae bacterium]